MRKHIFEAMFDVVAGTTTTYTPAEHNSAFGATDKFAVQTTVDQVTGTSPTITMAFEASNDQRIWVNKTTYRSGAALSTTTSQTFVDVDSGSSPTLGFGRFAITLGGTNPQARVKMIVCGRDEA